MNKFIIFLIIVIVVFVIFCLISEAIRQTCTLQEFKNVDTKKGSFSLTTTPSRIKHIEPNIQSLIKQNPKTIYLNVPHTFKKTGEHYQIPQWLEKYTNTGEVTLIRPEDKGPATKFMGLLEHQIHPEEYICIVDDDQIYNKYLLSNLIHKANSVGGNNVISCSGWKLRDKYNDMVMGVASFMLKRKLLDDIKKFDAPKECFTVDDPWISMYFKYNGIKTTPLFLINVSNTTISESPSNIFDMYKMISVRNEALDPSEYRSKVQTINPLYELRKINQDTKCVDNIYSEKNCKLLSTIGLLKSTDFYDYRIFNDRLLNTLYLLDTLSNMFDGCSIYVCTDLIDHFITFVLPRITKKFVLVSGYSDMTVPDEIILIDILLNNKYLIKWFAVDCKLLNDKVVQVPIGLDYHTIHDAYRSGQQTHKWITELELEEMSPKAQEKILNRVISSAKPFNERIPKIFVNFTLNKCGDKFGQRHDALAKIPKDLMEINLKPAKRTQTWKNMAKYTFILSPTGFGIDCHRTWEALCLGCIPIVKLPECNKMFEDLPVLNVNDWSDINENLLKQTISDFNKKKFNYDKLTLKYWTDLIKNQT